MKKNFETPEVELEKFQIEDALTTSIGDLEDTDVEITLPD